MPSTVTKIVARITTVARRVAQQSSGITEGVVESRNPDGTLNVNDGKGGCVIIAPRANVRVGQKIRIGTQQPPTNYTSLPQLTLPTYPNFPDWRPTYPRVPDWPGHTVSTLGRPPTGPGETSHGVPPGTEQPPGFLSPGRGAWPGSAGPGGLGGDGSPAGGGAGGPGGGSGGSGGSGGAGILPSVGPSPGGDGPPVIGPPDGGGGVGVLPPADVVIGASHQHFDSGPDRVVVMAASGSDWALRDGFTAEFWSDVNPFSELTEYPYTVGAALDAGTYLYWRTFLEFDTAGKIPDGAILTAAVVELPTGASSLAAPYTPGVFLTAGEDTGLPDYPLTVADWAQGGLGSGTLGISIGEASSLDPAVSPNKIPIHSYDLRHINRAGKTKFVLHSETEFAPSYSPNIINFNVAPAAITLRLSYSYL